MKLAATILGIIGGLAGVIGAVITIYVGGIGSAFGVEGARPVSALGFVALVFTIVSIVGGALAIPKPRLAGIPMLIGGIGGIIWIFTPYWSGGALVFVGGILALAGGILALIASGKPKFADIKA